MSAKNGGPAFPVTLPNHSGQCAPTECEMTLREYAAIHLKVPNSGTPWLDEMIRESLRDYLAAKAMQGLLPDSDFEYTAQEAYAMADAMLAERAKGGE